MKTFVIEETVPCVQVTTYTVKANSREEAIEAIMNNKTEPTEVITDEHDYDNISYEVMYQDGGFDFMLFNLDELDEDDDIVELERGEMEDEDDNNKSSDEYDSGAWDMQTR